MTIDEVATAAGVTTRVASNWVQRHGLRAVGRPDVETHVAPADLVEFLDSAGFAVTADLRKKAAATTDPPLPLVFTGVLTEQSYCQGNGTRDFVIDTDGEPGNGDDDSPDPWIDFKVTSFDDTDAHEVARPFAGRRVKVTVEVIRS